MPSVMTPGLPQLASAAASAPVGLADSGAQASFSAVGLRGVARLHAIATYNASLGLTSAHEASLQLNAFLTFRSNGTFFDYWAQTVLEIDTQTRAVYFEDNLWNASSPVNSALAPSALSGNGSVSNSSSGAYYADIAPASIPGAYATLAYPTTVVLGLNSSADALGRPVVHFWFDDGFGPRVFDDVTFVFGGSARNWYGFNVTSSLFTPSCPRCVGDAEFVWGGPSSGFQTGLSGPTDVAMSLEEWTGHTYAEVPEATSLGIATAEGLTNGTMTSNAAVGGVPNASLGLGSLARTDLWGPSSLARVHVSVGTTLPSGSWSLNGSVGGFAAGAVDLLAWPGVYDLTVRVGAGAYTVTGVLLTAQEWETLEVGAIAVVFVPQGLPNTTVWAVTLGNATLHGTGAVTFASSNGTWTYSVGSVTDFSSSPSSGSVFVNGTTVYSFVNWTHHPSSLADELRALLTLPLGPVPLWLAIALLVLLGSAAAVLGRKPRRRRPSPRVSEPVAWEP